MSPTRAQNRVRRQYGIGKGLLHKRLRTSRRRLYRFATDARWLKVPDEREIQEAHAVVDDLVTDSIIAAAYREAEK